MRWDRFEQAWALAWPQGLLYACSEHSCARAVHETKDLGYLVCVLGLIIPGNLGMVPACVPPIMEHLGLIEHYCRACRKFCTIGT